MLIVFFFKQKTAYEMRISDWSSDVCSSDLKELRRYDRAAVDGSYLDMAIVRAISERIGAMSQAERAAHPCIGPERADLVIAGCAILSALCRLWPAERLRVADRGLREGLLYAMIHGVSAPHRSEEHTSELQSLMRISSAV